MPEWYSALIVNPLALLIETPDYLPFIRINTLAIQVPDGCTENPIKPFAIISEVANCFSIKVEPLSLFHVWTQPICNMSVADCRAFPACTHSISLCCQNAETMAVSLCT